MGEIALESEFLDGDLLKISAVAGDMMQPVLGIAFNLNFDGENLDFLKYEPGEFLERGGDPFYLVKDEENKTKIRLSCLWGRTCILGKQVTAGMYDLSCSKISRFPLSKRAFYMQFLPCR